MGPVLERLQTDAVVMGSAPPRHLPPAERVAFGKSLRDRVRRVDQAGWPTDKHPHTNMAKAALNMMTRTSAADYVKDGIHMNAVDTGWVTDEDPIAISQRKQRDHDFQPPLDVVDGAARVCDPFFTGLNTGVHVYGKFLKDYRPAAW